MKSIAIVMAVALLSVFASGCNTVQGLGKDIEQGGKAIQRAS